MFRPAVEIQLQAMAMSLHQCLALNLIRKQKIAPLSPVVSASYGVPSIDDQEVASGGVEY